jgi:hypothetical protein
VIDTIITSEIFTPAENLSGEGIQSHLLQKDPEALPIIRTDGKMDKSEQDAPGIRQKNCFAHLGPYFSSHMFKDKMIR